MAEAGELIVADDEHLDNLGASPFRVQAYSVTIDKTLAQAGADIEIIARFVTFKDPGSIDVSGLDGIPKGDAKPAAAQFVPGNNGDKGNDGKPGGSIKIICESLSGNVTLNAMGGIGGAGQNGSDGAQGKPGATHQGRPGDRGGQGFPAGAGGQGGDGGPGGSISILTMDASKAVLSLSAYGGPGGDKGNHGKPGGGGPPGSGAWCHSVVGGRDGGDPVICGDSGNGGVGPPGVTPPDPPPSAKGATGTITKMTNLNATDLSQAISGSASKEYWEFLLSTSEQLYYDLSFSDAANHLQWILNTTV